MALSKEELRVWMKASMKVLKLVDLKVVTRVDSMARMLASLKVEWKALKMDVWLDSKTVG